jgi:putative tricarboxylic transport membrane protein
MVKSTEFWGGLFWLALGVFVIWAGRDLGLGQINDPGSGFALFWVGLLTTGLAGSVLLSAFREPGAELAALWSGTRWAKVLAVVVLLVAYGLLFERVGFIVCSVVLLLVLMMFIDPVDPRFAWPIALLVPVGIWWSVTKGLKIQMPAGVLEPWLG